MIDQPNPPSALADLALGNVVEIDAEGGSMFPLIRDGDRVTVQPLKREPRIGDVVLAVIAGRWVLHRVIAVRGAEWVTRGDYRLRPDPPIRRAQIVGLAVRTQRRGRTIGLDWPQGAARAWARVAPLGAVAVRGAASLGRSLRTLRSATRD